MNLKVIIGIIGAILLFYFHLEEFSLMHRSGKNLGILPIDL